MQVEQTREQQVNRGTHCSRRGLQSKPGIVMKHRDSVEVGSPIESVSRSQITQLVGLLDELLDVVYLRRDRHNAVERSEMMSVPVRLQDASRTEAIKVMMAFENHARLSGGEFAWNQLGGF